MTKAQTWIERELLPFIEGNFKYQSKYMPGSPWHNGFCFASDEVASFINDHKSQWQEPE